MEEGAHRLTDQEHRTWQRRLYWSASLLPVVFVNQVGLVRARWLTTTTGARGGLSLAVSPVFRVGTTWEGF